MQLTKRTPFWPVSFFKKRNLKPRIARSVHVSYKLVQKWRPERNGWWGEETEREVEPLIFTLQNGFPLSSPSELPHGEVRTNASCASRAEVSCCPHISEKMWREEGRNAMGLGWGREGSYLLCHFQEDIPARLFIYVRNVSWGLCVTNNIEEMETQNSFWA